MIANNLDLQGHLYKLQFLMACQTYVWGLSFPVVYILLSFEGLENWNLKFKYKNEDINKPFENGSSVEIH